MSDHEDVIIPDFYDQAGIWPPDENPKQIEKEDAQRRALMRFWSRLPKEDRSKIAYMEWEPRTGSTEYRGRFTLEENDWDLLARRIISKYPEEWNPDGTPRK